MKKVLLASGNQGKLFELQNAFESLPIELIAQPKLTEYEVAETGTTFVENAIIKARHAAKLSGFAAIADDSGLIVEALDGAPGVISARYSGTDATSQSNMELLLANMTGIKNRTARFVCVLVYIRHANDPLPIIAEGSWAGEIADAQSGEKGFGYDPVFYLPKLGKTSAQLDKTTKFSYSHRGAAVKKLLQLLKQIL
ncbi:MAG: RdgB/HAM1 family non-canonical purine NTP pyrophosphatase [Proteobacteria bacterium]|nr:RdgB/HAM1 family non-canonical purine NTP pyrophosphatase [Pseudomonadota bacterium]